jgi:hypothetical protein
VPIGSVAIYLAIAGLALAQGPRRGATWGRRLALVVIGALALAVALRGGIDAQTLLNDPPFFDLFAVLAAILLAADLSGLPLPIAQRLRLGLRSREWEFDRRLTALTNEARRSVDRASVEVRRRELPGIIVRMAALRAPDDDWAALRDEWAAAWQRYLDALTDDGNPTSSADALRHHEYLIQQTKLLRARYRTEASRILGKDS